MLYKAVRVILTLVLAAGLAFGALQASQLYVGIALLAGAGVIGWMLVRRADLLAENTKREQRAEEYAAEHRRERKKSTDVVAVLLLAGCGVAMVFATFADHSTARVSGFLKPLLYSFLGISGATILFALIAAFMLVVAIEIGLGMFLARKSA